MKLINLVIIFLLCGCGNNNSQCYYPMQNKYKEGDIVYLKPDSIKSTIISIFSYSNNSYKYTIMYNDKQTNEHKYDYVWEYNIY